MNASDLTKKRREQIAQIRDLLRNPLAAPMMEILEEEFYHCRLQGKTPEETAYNCGAREVVRILREIRDREEADG